MSNKIIDALNKNREDELSAIIQYMKHAEKRVERINYLGGVPTKKPSMIVEGGDLKKMIQDDLAKENGAIKQYKEHIKLAIEENDPTTRLMLEEILSDEEGHADTWE